MGINPQQYMGYGQSYGYGQMMPQQQTGMLQNNYGTTYNYFGGTSTPTTSTGSTSTHHTTPPPELTPQSGTLSKKDDGSINYKTTGGWTVNVKDGTITMTSPDGKDSTKIWGDPHVAEADGSKWDWSSKTGTFLLPDGTKVTMNADSPTGVVKSTSIYDKAQEVKINNEKMTFTSSVDRKKTREDEQKEDDGKAYSTKNQGNDWTETAASKKVSAKKST